MTLSPVDAEPLVTNAVSRFPMIFSAIVLVFFVIGFVIWIGGYIDARAEAREKIIALAQSKLEDRQDCAN